MPNQNPFDSFQGLNQAELSTDIKKKTEPIAKQVGTIYRAIRDELNQRDLFLKPHQYTGELRPFSVTDKSRRNYIFPLRSNGKTWDVDGPSIMSYLNFIEDIIHTAKGYQATLQEALVGQVQHLAFHKRIIDAHPIIGTAIFLARQASKEISNRFQQDQRVTPDSQSKNQSIWFERHMELAGVALRAIDTTFDKLSKRVNDELSRTFLSDVRKESELLVMDACNVSFLQFSKYVNELRAGKHIIPCIIQEAAFPISMKEYAAYEDHIISLRTLYSTYHSEAVLSAFPMPQPSEIREKGYIQLPVIVSNEDLFHLLSTYASFWSDFADGLRQDRAYPVRGSAARIINSLEIGLRQGHNIGQDRFSFRMPGFNIRIDKDSDRKTLACDIGGVSLLHALACLESFFTSITVESRAPSIFRNTTALDDASVQLEQKVALLASMLMAQSAPMGLRKSATISHHSREFVAKEEYYTHFSHILASIREGLERPAH